MTTPTQDQINTATLAWFEANIATGAIGQNTSGAYNQVESGMDVLNTMLYTALDATAVAAATDTLTSAANYTNSQTITIDGKVYTLQTSLTNVDGNIKLGASEAATILNIHHAINGTGGTSGTDYAASTVAHPTVTATDDSAHVVTVTAKLKGSDGNSIAVSTTSSAVWATPTLTGGTGDNVDNLVAAANTWRDTLRCVPLEDDDDSIAQMDGSMAALSTAIEGLF